MKKKWCAVFGHRWQHVWSSAGAKGAPIYVCLRCRENGWLV